MISQFKELKAEYLIFFAYSLLSLILFWGFSQSFQKYTVLLLYAGFYFIWSIITNIINKTLSLKNLLESFLLSALGVLTLKIIFFPNLWKA